jgi:tetratricopeptide (TPR) repeat protein
VLAYQAWVASQQGRLDRSTTLGEEALSVQRAFTGERSADYLTVASHIASNHLARGELDAAAALLAVIERHGPSLADYPITDQIGQRASLANLNFNRGDYAAAERTLAEIVPLFDRHIGPQHDRTAVARALHARSLAELGRYTEAVKEQQTNVANVAARSRVEPEALQLARLQLARLLTQAGRYDEAVVTAREAVEFFDRRYAEPTRYREAARWFLADALLGQGQRDEGLRTLQASLANAEKLGKANNPLERASKQLALALASRDLVGVEAARQAEQVCALLAQALGAANPRTIRCRAVEAWLHARLASPEVRPAALSAFVSAREQALAALVDAHPLRAELLAAEAEVLAADPARQGESRALFERADAQYRSVLGVPLPRPLLALH